MEKHSSILGYCKTREQKKNWGWGSTNIWKIPWLPCMPNVYLTTVIPNELEKVQVTNLMNESGNGWDDKILKDIFNDRDIELINSIPISRNVQQDSWF